MRQRLKCPQGHEWESLTDEHTPASASAVCPVCSAQALSTTGSKAETRAPTVENKTPPGSAGTPAKSKPTPAKPEIPGYEILEPLASGGMGVVFKARQQRLDRLVALKIIRPEHLTHRTAVARFLREARAAARLAHPNIVSIFDADQAGSTHYLVMEFVEGIDLAHVVHRHGPLPTSVACRFIRQAALGLQHAYERGLVHRDIKPHNLMVTPAPPPPPASLLDLADQFVVKILDMGLVRIHDPVDEAEAPSSLTQSGHVLGTPDYISPEQVEDAGSVDIRSDLYSLGCTFYFLLTGRVPFPGMSLIQKFDGHRWGAPPPVAKLRPEVVAEVVAVVNRLMAKKPEERYQRPIELADELARLLRLPASGSTAGGASDTGRALATGTHRAPATAPAISLPAVEAAAPAASAHCQLRLLGHPDEVTAVVFAPDGRTIASGGRDGRLVLWDAGTGQQIRRLPDHPEGVRCLVFSPGGKHLVSAGPDRLIRFWEVQTGRELGRLQGHTADVESIVFLADGKRLVSGGKDQSVRFWSVETGKEIRRIGGAVVQRHWDGVLSVAVAPDGRLAASGSRDQTGRLWDLETGRELRCLKDHTQAVQAVAFTPDGKYVLSASGNRLRLWDVGSGALVRAFDGHEKPILCAALAPDGRRAASAGADRTVRVWDVAGGQQLHCFTGHSDVIHSVAYSPSGASLASAGADRCICVWTT